MIKQTPRRLTHAKRTGRGFNYDLDYKTLDLREHPELYRVGRGEQGVLLVEPYKSEILPHWRFKTPDEARKSAVAITQFFRRYRKDRDFVGMDMSRKFLQMGYTRARRYANHASGRKYGADGEMLPFANDPIKAQSAEIFWHAWQKVEADPLYCAEKIAWKKRELQSQIKGTKFLPQTD